jgi:hypothetical protein
MATTTKATKPLDPEDLIDIPRGAKMVFVSKKTIANWLSQGVLTRYKVNNGRTLVSRTELLALIRKED